MIRAMEAANWATENTLPIRFTFLPESLLSFNELVILYDVNFKAGNKPTSTPVKAPIKSTTIK